MQEIIDFLYEKEREISAYEVLEISKIASSVLSKRNKDDKENDIENINEKAMQNDTIGFLQSLTGFDADLYRYAEKKIFAQNPERTKIVRFTRTLIDILRQNKNIPIVEFSDVSEIVTYMKMPYKMQVKFFMYIIKTNGIDANHEEKNMYLPNYSALLEHNYKHISSKEVFELIESFKIHEYITEENPDNPEAQRELYKVYIETCMDYTEQYKASIRLDHIFLKHPDTLTPDDYEQIDKEMQMLNFADLSNHIIKAIKKCEHLDTKDIKDVYTLINSPSGKYKSKKIISTPSKTNQNREPDKPKHSNKEINQIYYEISKLYDLEHFKSKTVLSLDEIIYLLSLMYKIEMKENVIIRFLDSVSREYRKNNPICIFYQSYDKFKSYDNEDINEHLEMLEYIINDTNIFICSNDEYEETKELVSVEINAIMDILSGNYTYEINKAKSLLKVNKEGDNNAKSN